MVFATATTTPQKAILDQDAVWQELQKTHQEYKKNNNKLEVMAMLTRMTNKK